MREITFRGKTRYKGEWVEGCLISLEGFTAILEKQDTGHFEYPYLDDDLGIIDGDCIPVDPATVCQYTGITDKNDKAIVEGDIVDLFGSRGMVTFECGAFGVGFRSTIDYDTMQQRIYDLTGTRNTLHCCFNDNFLSLWEIFWNFNCDDNSCHVLEVVGNIHDNPELLQQC